MCPVAAESKNSNPSSKKKIIKKIDSNLEKDQKEEEQIIRDQDTVKNLQQNPDDNTRKIELNDQFNDSDEEAKALGNIKLGPKGIYTEESIRVYLQELEE